MLVRGDGIRAPQLQQRPIGTKQDLRDPLSEVPFF